MVQALHDRMPVNVLEMTGPKGAEVACGAIITAASAQHTRHLRERRELQRCYDFVGCAPAGQERLHHRDGSDPNAAACTRLADRENRNRTMSMTRRRFLHTTGATTLLAARSPGGRVVSPLKDAAGVPPIPDITAGRTSGASAGPGTGRPLHPQPRQLHVGLRVGRVREGRHRLA